MSYVNDRKWSEQFIPEIKKIVGPLLLVESTFEIDTKQAADLVILKARDVMIAARIRRQGYDDRYPYEFTVRSKRDSGAKTELAKLIDGWGDWMFYGHAGQHTGSIIRWMVIDLDSWRKELLLCGYKKAWSTLATHKCNGDGTYFFAFDVRKFHPTMVISSSHSLAMEGALF